MQNYRSGAAQERRKLGENEAMEFLKGDIEITGVTRAGWVYLIVCGALIVGSPVAGIVYLILMR